MTGRPGRAAAPSAVLALLVLLVLSGCVVVHGRPLTGASHRSAGPPVAGDQAGLARPFPSLPTVTPVAVPDGYDPAADAPAELAAALRAARADGRPVLLDFGAAWCQDCRALTALTQSPGVHQILSRDYHVVTVDVGHYDHNTDLAARYVNLSGSGIPALAVLAPDGSTRPDPGAAQFSDARNFSADQVANILVDWLYAQN